MTHHVYRCYSADGDLLYVGCAKDVEARMFHHLHACNIGKQPNATLQQRMATFTSEPHADLKSARQAEREAIAAEAPLVNKQHNPARFKKVTGSTYAAIEPVHEISRQAFPDLPVLAGA